MNISINNNGYPVRPTDKLDTRPAGAAGKVAPTSAASADSVAFSQEGLKMARWIEQAKSEPEVRAHKVAEFQDQIRTGNYPPPALAEGLARLLGTGILSAARA